MCVCVLAAQLLIQTELKCKLDICCCVHPDKSARPLLHSSERSARRSVVPTDEGERAAPHSQHHSHTSNRPIPLSYASGMTIWVIREIDWQVCMWNRDECEHLSDPAVWPFSALISKHIHDYIYKGFGRDCITAASLIWTQIQLWVEASWPV